MSEPIIAVEHVYKSVTDSTGTVHSVEAEDGFLSVDHDRVEIVARNAKLA